MILFIVSIYVLEANIKSFLIQFNWFKPTYRNASNDIYSDEGRAPTENALGRP